MKIGFYKILSHDTLNHALLVHEQNRYIHKIFRDFKFLHSSITKTNVLQHINQKSARKLNQSINRLILVTLLTHNKPPQNNTLSVSLRSLSLSLLLSLSLHATRVKISSPYVHEWNAIWKIQEPHHMTKKHR